LLELSEGQGNDRIGVIWRRLLGLLWISFHKFAAMAMGRLELPGAKWWSEPPIRDKSILIPGECRAVYSNAFTELLLILRKTVPKFT
jgi:hypothetical protein